VFTLT